MKNIVFNSLVFDLLPLPFELGRKKEKASKKASKNMFKNTLMELRNNILLDIHVW